MTKTKEYRRHESGGAFVSPPPTTDTQFPAAKEHKEAVKSGEAARSGGAFTQVDKPAYPSADDC